MVVKQINSRNSILFAFIGMLSLFVGFLVIYKAFKDAVQVDLIVDNIIEKDLYTNYYNDPLVRAIEIVTKDSKFRGKVNINKAIDDEYLNIYVLKMELKADSSAPNNVRKLQGGCGYLGAKNVIVCDSWFIFEFSLRHKLGGNPESLNKWTELEMFLTWVIGHEIGHILAGHSKHGFSMNDFDRKLVGSAWKHKIELEADQYLVDIVTKDMELEYNIVSFLIWVLGRETNMNNYGSYDGTFSNDNNRRTSIGYIGETPYNNDEYYPEYVVRISRLLLGISLVKGPGKDVLLGEVRAYIRGMRPNEINN